jgi:hypothetical protein
MMITDSSRDIMSGHVLLTFDTIGVTENMDAEAAKYCLEHYNFMPRKVNVVEGNSTKGGDNYTIALCVF